MSNEIEIKVGVIASFTGLKFLPQPIGVAYNNLNPMLELYENKLVFKTITEATKNYSSIKVIDVYFEKKRILGVSTNNICIVFNDSIFTFSANMKKKKELVEVLLFLKDKDIPLSKRAKLFLSSKQTQSV